MLITSCLFVAENDALRKVLAMKEHVSTMIPRPEKGNAGKGFNLQEAMGLADDEETYALLQVSSQYYIITIFKMLLIVALCTGPGCSSWAQLFGNVVPPIQRHYQQDNWSGMSLSLLKIVIFLRILYSRHVSVTAT